MIDFCVKTENVRDNLNYLKNKVKFIVLDIGQKFNC